MNNLAHFTSSTASSESTQDEDFSYMQYAFKCKLNKKRSRKILDCRNVKTVSSRGSLTGVNSAREKAHKTLVKSSSMPIVPQNSEIQPLGQRKRVSFAPGTKLHSNHTVLSRSSVRLQKKLAT